MLIDDDSSLVVEEKPSEAFLVDMIQKLQEQVNAFRVTVEGLQTELISERIIHQNKVSRLEEELETQSRLIDTLKEKLDASRVLPEDRNSYERQRTNGQPRSEEQKFNEKVFLEDTSNGRTLVNDNEINIEKEEVSCQTDIVLKLEQHTQTSKEIFQITKLVNELLFGTRDLTKTDRKISSSATRVNTPRHSIPLQSSTQKQRTSSGIHIMSYSTPNHNQELLQQQLLTQVEELKKLIPISTVDQMVGHLLRVELALRSNNALENWILFAKLSKLQLTVEAMQSVNTNTRLEKRVTFTKMIKIRIEQLLKERRARREKYRITRHTLYDHWVYCIFESLKYHSDVTPRSGALSHRAIDPRQQLKVMIEKFDLIDDDLSSNLHSRAKIESKLNNRDKMKVNAIAPLFNHNFSDMTVSRRKVVLSEFLDFVFRARLEQVTDSGYGTHELYEYNSPRRESKSQFNSMPASPIVTPREVNSVSIPFATPRDNRINHDRMPGFKLFIPNIAIPTRAISPPKISPTVFKRRYRGSQT